MSPPADIAVMHIDIDGESHGVAHCITAVCSPANGESSRPSDVDQLLAVGYPFPSTKSMNM